jgi:hypothetical protein
MKVKALFTVGLLGALGVAACAILDDAHQCATDDDCAGFAAVCDTVQSICVPPGSIPGDGGGPTTDAPPGKTPDGSTTDAPPLPPQCTVSPKPIGNPSAGLPAGPDGGGQVAQSLTLGCEKDWILEGPLFVPSGATLTIAAGTTIKAKKGTNASIQVAVGGKIIANGQRDAPIVMTVDDPAPVAGQWVGLSIVGSAAADDSGSLSFVRVEYSQSGVLFTNVGNKTKVDSIQVRLSNDACFTFFGGNVDAKHLVCQAAVDEHFETGAGYKGRLQFLYSQRSGDGAGHHGILIDGAGTAPIVYNATLCGRATPQAVQNYGILFRNGAAFDMNNILLHGWNGAIEATGALGNPIVLRSSRAFNNSANPAYEEDAAADAGTPIADDDNGFDEIEFFADGGNQTTNPNIVDCYSATAPKPWTSATIAGRKPPNDGFFDTTAEYIGAFKDANDGWMTGPWVKFAGN